MWPLYILLCLLAVAIYLIVDDQRTRSYFNSKRIFYIGNGTIRLIRNIITRQNFIHDLTRQYELVKTTGNKVSVSRDFGVTGVLVTDVDMIKSILVKDFDHFADRRNFQTGNADYLFAKMLIAVTGDRWKQLRAKLSPTFTTGKIKRMFRLFDQSGKKFVKFLELEIQRSGNGEIELSEGYSKFTMDIIASAACGIDSQAFNQKEPSLFERMGKGLQLEFGGLMILKMIVMLIIPTRISDALGLSFFSKEVQDFFSVAIKSSIKQRVDKGEKRDDFVQLMLEARAGTLKTEESELEAFEKDAMIKEGDERKLANADLLDDEGIVANCVLFILAGFDTTQSLLLFCAYALAIHQDIQDKLRAEVDTLLEEQNGDLTYDDLSKMTFLDMVIQETLRFYPPAFATDRQCVKDYKIPGTDFVLKKGGAVFIPIMGIHHDPEYFPEPEKFDPERFSPENKSKINPYTMLSFGQGPRNCIGMRFALTEAKVVLSYLIHNFKIEPSTKTLIPMKYSNSSSLKPEGGMHLRLTKIQRP